MKNRALLEFLKVIEEPNQAACLKMYHEHYDRIQKATSTKVPGKNVTGSLQMQLVSALTFAVHLYYFDNRGKGWQFKLSDLILVLFLHNIGILFSSTGAASRTTSSEEIRTKVMNYALSCGMHFKEIHLNALKYVHSDDPHCPVNGKLDAMFRICDLYGTWFAK